MPDIDIKAFSAACENLYAPRLSLGNYVNRSFAFLQRLVPGEFVACGELDPDSKELSMVFDSDHPDFGKAMETFGSLMHKYPMYAWDPSVKGGRPFCRHDFFGQTEFRNLDIYQEVYRPLGIDNHCAVHVPTCNGKIMFFGIERAAGPDYSPEELDVLQAAQKQLGAAHLLAWSQAETLEEPLDVGLLVSFGLTPREAETLYWMDQGKSNSEIGMLLKIRLYTVKDHIRAVFNKIGVDNRLAAIVWARRTCYRSRQMAAACSPWLKVPVRA